MALLPYLDPSLRPSSSSSSARSSVRLRWFHWGTRLTFRSSSGPPSDLNHRRDLLILLGKGQMVFFH